MWWALAATGAGAGFLGALVGAGGGFLAVPALVLGFRLPPAQAAGMSLTMVAAGALAASAARLGRGQVRYRLGALFASASYPGALAGTWLAARLPAAAFAPAFGVLLLLLAGWLLRPPGARAPLRPSEADGRPSRSPGLPRTLVAAGASLATGCLATLFGIGGGPIQVPALIGLLGLPPAAAVATSQFILIFTAGVGAVAYMRSGVVPPGPALALAAGGVAGAWAGARCAARLSGRAVVWLLAGLMALTALRLLRGIG